MALLLAAFSAQGQPARVILMRHAEKPADDKDRHLSPVGRERARFLAEWFTQTPALTNDGPPVALYATRPATRHRSERPRETVEPLAHRLELKIETPYGAEEYGKLARELLHDPRLRGKTVVICWVHDYLPQFAAALGVKPQPHSWPRSDFDRAYLITFAEGGAKLDYLRQHFHAKPPSPEPSSR